MNLKRVLSTPAQSTSGSFALLLLRVTVGCAFVIISWGKIQHPMSWMGPNSSFPPFLQLLAAVAEFGGGLAWILGFLTPIASLGIGVTMIVAVRMHVVVMKDPFINPTGGSSYQIALVYLCVAVLFLLIGPGKFSLDRIFFGERK